MGYRYDRLSIWIPRCACSVCQVLSNKCRILDRPRAYDACETKDLDYLSTLHIFNKTKAQRQDMRLERLTRHHFAVFIYMNVHEDFLVGSCADYKNKIDRFVNELKAHMVDFMRKAGDDFEDSEDD